MDTSGEDSEEVVVTEREVSFVIFRDEAWILVVELLEERFHFLGDESEFSLLRSVILTEVINWSESIDEVKTKLVILDVILPSFV